ncbi:hypothetical protein Vafri_15669, partial [Volvox africanus]
CTPCPSDGWRSRAVPGGLKPHSLRFEPSPECEVSLAVGSYKPAERGTQKNLSILPTDPPSPHHFLRCIRIDFDHLGRPEFRKVRQTLSGDIGVDEVGNAVVDRSREPDDDDDDEVVVVVEDTSTITDRWKGAGYPLLPFLPPIWIWFSHRRAAVDIQMYQNSQSKLVVGSFWY